jgi:uncharacterized protein YraI
MFFLRNGLRLVLLAAAVAIAMPAMATAAARPNGYPVTSVSLRAGPGTDYPKILTVPARAPIYILGCLGDYTWCDVVFARNRRSARRRLGQSRRLLQSACAFRELGLASGTICLRA